MKDSAKILICVGESAAALLGSLNEIDHVRRLAVLPGTMTALGSSASNAAVRLSPLPLPDWDNIKPAYEEGRFFIRKSLFEGGLLKRLAEAFPVQTLSDHFGIVFALDHSDMFASAVIWDVISAVSVMLPPDVKALDAALLVLMGSSAKTDDRSEDTHIKHIKEAEKYAFFKEIKMFREKRDALAFPRFSNRGVVLVDRELLTKDNGILGSLLSVMHERLIHQGPKMNLILGAEVLPKSIITLFETRLAHEVSRHLLSTAQALPHRQLAEHCLMELGVRAEDVISWLEQGERAVGAFLDSSESKSSAELISFVFSQEMDAFASAAKHFQGLLARRDLPGKAANVFFRLFDNSGLTEVREIAACACEIIEKEIATVSGRLYCLEREMPTLEEFIKRTFEATSFKTYLTAKAASARLGQALIFLELIKEDLRQYITRTIDLRIECVKKAQVFMREETERLEAHMRAEGVGEDPLDRLYGLWHRALPKHLIPEEKASEIRVRGIKNEGSGIIRTSDLDQILPGVFLAALRHSVEVDLAQAQPFLSADFLSEEVKEVAVRSLQRMEAGYLRKGENAADSTTYICSPSFRRPINDIGILEPGEPLTALSEQSSGSGIFLLRAFDALAGDSLLPFSEWKADYEMAVEESIPVHVIKSAVYMDEPDEGSGDAQPPDLPPEALLAVATYLKAIERLDDKVCLEAKQARFWGVLWDKEKEKPIPVSIDKMLDLMHADPVLMNILSGIVQARAEASLLKGPTNKTELLDSIRAILKPYGQTPFGGSVERYLEYMEAAFDTLMHSTDNGLSPA